MDHRINVTAGANPPFNYGGDVTKHVRRKDRLMWNCSNAPIIVIFEYGSPFVNGKKVVFALAGADTSIIEIRAPKDDQPEPLKYTVIAFYGGQIVPDDPVIIIDNDGGGGGGPKKKTAKKKAAKK